MGVIEGLLSSWIFVGFVTGVVAGAAVLVGFLLARAKIKKGFDVYED